MARPCPDKHFLEQGQSREAAHFNILPFHGSDSGLSSKNLQTMGEIQLMWCY